MKKICSALLICTLLSACGDGGGANGSTSNAPQTSVDPNNQSPVALPASITLAYNQPRTITLSATDAESNTLTYAISTQANYGNLTPLAIAGTFQYTPTSPHIGSDTFAFVASDGNTTSLPATVTLNTWSDTWPLANAGEDQLAYGNTAIQVSGQAFNEGASAYDWSGKKLPLSYRWQQTDGSGFQTALTDANTPTLRIQTPNVLNTTTLSFQLTVTTTTGAFATDQINLTIKPMQSQSKVSLGAYLPSDAWDTYQIDQYNRETDMPVSIVNLFSDFDHDWQTIKSLADNIRTRNAVPMVTWMPQQAAQPGKSLLTEINHGTHDAYIDRWINGLKSWQASYPSAYQPRLLIRFGHEFNGDWYSWSNNPTAFRQAWQHLHDRFVAAKVSNVEWVWCINNISFDDQNDVTRYYPGDAYVDWTAIDGYNWGSNLRYVQWRSFDEVFSRAYTTLATTYPSKPIMIAEVASAEPDDQPDPSRGLDGDDSDARESKEAWVRDMFASIETSYPAVRSLMWFNHDKVLSWALNGSGHTGVNAYLESVNASQHFGGAYRPASMQ